MAGGVWVCDACLTAACWNGEFYCEKFKTAGVRKMTVDKLRKLKREHPSNWNRPWNDYRRSRKGV